MFERIKQFINSLFGSQEPEVDYNSMTKAQLREFAESKGIKLPQRINKDQMILLIKQEV